ncbi:MAG: hypothetical protein ABSC06_29815 [Rhodopila sp.]
MAKADRAGAAAWLLICLRRFKPALIAASDYNQNGQFFGAKPGAIGEPNAVQLQSVATLAGDVLAGTVSPATFASAIAARQPLAFIGQNTVQTGSGLLTNAPTPEPIPTGGWRFHHDHQSGHANRLGERGHRRHPAWADRGRLFCGRLALQAGGEHLLWRQSCGVGSQQRRQLPAVWRRRMSDAAAAHAQTTHMSVNGGRR